MHHDPRRQPFVLNASMPRPYERIDDGEHPEIATMRVVGPTHRELFENAAEAMFSIGYDLATIPPTYSHPIVAPGDSLEELLVNWLEELIFASGAVGIVWSSCVVDRLEVGGVQGSASGMPVDEVAPRGAMVVGVADRPVTLVDVPEGCWVDVAFRLASGLRLV